MGSQWGTFRSIQPVTENQTQQSGLKFSIQNNSLESLQFQKTDELLTSTKVVLATHLIETIL